MKQVIANINKTVRNRLHANNQDKSFYGTKFQNALAILGLGWLSSDVETGAIHVHDGKTPGGFIISSTGPVFNSYQEMLDQDFDGETCRIVGGGVITKTALGWVGDLGVVADEATANALTGVAPGARISTATGDFMVWQP